MADDKLADALAAMGLRRNLACTHADYQDVARDSDQLRTVLNALLKAHKPIQIYDSADGCPHPRPGEDERGGDALSEWCDDHPSGSGIVPDADVAAICLESPREVACRACSELVYGRWGDEDRWVTAAECIVRPLVTAALLGEEAGNAEG